MKYCFVIVKTFCKSLYCLLKLFSMVAQGAQSTATWENRQREYFHQFDDTYAAENVLQIQKTHTEKFYKVQYLSLNVLFSQVAVSLISSPLHLATKRSETGDVCWGWIFCFLTYVYVFLRSLPTSELLTTSMTRWTLTEWSWSTSKSNRST